MNTSGHFQIVISTISFELGLSVEQIFRRRYLFLLKPSILWESSAMPIEIYCIYEEIINCTGSSVMQSWCDEEICHVDVLSNFNVEWMDGKS